jgi:hypothetical protein
MEAMRKLRERGGHRDVAVRTLAVVREGGAVKPLIWSCEGCGNVYRDEGDAKHLDCKKCVRGCGDYQYAVRNPLMEGDEGVKREAVCWRCGLVMGKYSAVEHALRCDKPIPAPVDSKASALAEGLVRIRRISLFRRRRRGVWEGSWLARINGGKYVNLGTVDKEEAVRMGERLVAEMPDEVEVEGEVETRVATIHGAEVTLSRRKGGGVGGREWWIDIDGKAVMLGEKSWGRVVDAARVVLRKGVEAGCQMRANGALSADGINLSQEAVRKVHG